jgi:hypothetical protein
MLAYARPEFYITFWLFVFMYAANKIYKKEWSFFYNKSLLIAIAVLLIINYAVFPPNFSYKGEDRLYMAFKQHFIYNYIQIYDVKANSLWVAKDAIYKQFFGNCKSLNCIISEHPIYYCKHIFLNLILYIKLILFYFLDMISPKILHYKKLHLLISFIFLGICSIAIMKQKNEILLKVKNVIKDNTLLILFSILICATFSVSSLIIFPRQHYLFYFLIFIYNSML